MTEDILTVNSFVFNNVSSEAGFDLIKTSGHGASKPNVFSVISVNSVRDRFRSFLSPASLEPAEDAEEDRWSEFLIRPQIQTNTSPLRGDESFSGSSEENRWREL